MSLVLNVEILGEFKKLTAATQGAGKELNTLSGTATKISKGINKAFAAIGLGLSLAVVTRELKEATQAAIEDRQSQKLLENQLQNSIGVTDKQVKSIERQISALQMSTNVTDDKLRPSFAAFVRVTKDSTEAMKLLKLATDVSAGSGKNLEAVTMALSKAYQGKMTALTKLGLPMSDSIQNASDYAREMTKLNKLQSEAAGLTGPDYVKAMEKVAAQQSKVNAIAEAGIDWQKDLGEAFAGSAKKAADLDPYQRMQVLFGEIQERVGTALLPVLDKFSAWLSSPGGQEQLEAIVNVVTDLLKRLTDTALWAAKNKDWLLPLATGAGSVAAAAVAISKVTDAINAAKAAMVLFNTTTMLNPLVLAGVGIAGVAAYTAELSKPEISKGATDIIAGKNALIPGADVISGITVPKAGTTSPRVAERAPVNVVINTPKVSAQEVVNIINKAQKTGYTGQITMPRS